MATPDFVKFSRIPGTPSEAYARLAAEFFPLFKIRPRDFVRLRRSNDPYDAGMAEHGDRVEVTDAARYAELAKDEPLFGSSHEVPYVPAYLYLHCFDVEPSAFSMTSVVSSSLVYFQNHEYDAGQWLKAALALLTATLGAQVCGFGPGAHYDVAYESLDPDEVLSRLRSGQLFDIWYPTFHAISIDLIGVEEFDGLMQSRKVTLATQDLQHEISISGYHLLWNLP